MNQRMLYMAKWFEYGYSEGMSISQVMQVMAGRKDCVYKRACAFVDVTLNGWKQMAGVPVISVFERVDRMPAEVREALTKYIIKLESSN